jgi:hypothetical protein
MQKFNKSCQSTAKDFSFSLLEAGLDNADLDTGFDDQKLKKTTAEKNNIFYNFFLFLWVFFLS